ncbi:MAG: tRNA-guanine transglycosylase, partial [Candidatus Rokuibacteriota bacterium]
VGRPADLVEAVADGVDLFDCVLPTRHARTGQLFTREGLLVIKHAAWARDARPIDERCPCYACRHLSRAYLRHLFLARELTVYRLQTLHNLTFYLGLMGEVRAAIAAGSFETLRRAVRDTYASAGAEAVTVPGGPPLAQEDPS